MWELKVEHVEGFKRRFVLLTLLSLLLLMGFNGTCSILFYGNKCAAETYKLISRVLTYCTPTILAPSSAGFCKANVPACGAKTWWSGNTESKGRRGLKSRG